MKFKRANRPHDSCENRHLLLRGKSITHAYDVMQDEAAVQLLVRQIHSTVKARQT